MGWNNEIERTEGVYVDAKEISNFVLGDALHLPFREKVFNKVLCNHVIEHVSNPYQLMQELLRVCNDKVDIKCPHRFSKNAKTPYHRNYFTRTWFVTVLKGHRHKITTKYWYPLGGMLSLIRLPDEIRVEVLLKFSLNTEMERMEMAE